MIKKIIDFIIAIPLVIIYPNRLLALFKVRNLDQRSNQILGNDRVVRLIAFVAAVIFVVSVRYTPAPPDSFQQTVTIPLDKILDEAYTDFGSIIPEVVTLTLSGDRAQIELLIHGSDLRASIDLNAIGPGEHPTVFIDPPEGLPSEVTWALNPAVVEDIEIARLEEATFPIRVFSTLPELPINSRYRFGEPTVYPAELTIRGPQRILDEIDEVLVSFIVSTELVVPGVITSPGIAVPQSHFERIRGLEFDSEVEVRMEVYEHIKTIPITFDPVLMNVPRGEYVIVDATSNLEEIVVWGDFEGMTDVIEVPRINFRELNDEQAFIYRVILPPNVFTEIDGEIVTAFDIIIAVEFEEVLPTDDDDDE